MQLNPRFSQFSRGARLVALPAALAGCLLIASGASFATTGQTAAQTPPPQVAAAALPQAPEPFAPADIPLEADNTVQTLARIDTIVAADPQVTAIEVGLPGPEASIAADVAALEAIDPGTILQRTLEDLQQTWLVHQRNLLEPTTTVGNRYQQLQGELVILNDLDTRWQATLDNTQAQGELTEPLREIIGNQQAAIAATRAACAPASMLCWRSKRAWRRSTTRSRRLSI